MISSILTNCMRIARLHASSFEARKSQRAWRPRKVGWAKRAASWNGVYARWMVVSITRRSLKPFKTNRKLCSESLPSQQCGTEQEALSLIRRAGSAMLPPLSGCKDARSTSPRPTCEVWREEREGARTRGAREA
jgi:hypothetical protein